MANGERVCRMCDKKMRILRFFVREIILVKSSESINGQGFWSRKRLQFVSGFEGLAIRRTRPLCDPSVVYLNRHLHLYTTCFQLP